MKMTLMGSEFHYFTFCGIETHPNRQEKYIHSQSIIKLYSFRAKLDNSFSAFISSNLYAFGQPLRLTTYIGSKIQ